MLQTESDLVALLPTVISNVLHELLCPFSFLDEVLWYNFTTTLVVYFVNVTVTILIYSVHRDRFTTY